MHSLIRLALAASFCTVLNTSLAGQGQTKPIDPANLDTTCSPCKNFFQYANGGWLKRSVIPGDQPRWGSFNELQEQNYTALQACSPRPPQTHRRPRIELEEAGTFYGAAWIPLRSNGQVLVRLRVS